MSKSTSLPTGQLTFADKDTSFPTGSSIKNQRVSIAAVVENKRLGHALALVKAKQDLKEAGMPDDLYQR